jgi:hypothetical protein
MLDIINPLCPEAIVSDHGGVFLSHEAKSYGPGPRRKKKKLVFLQIPLFHDHDGTLG